MSAALAAKGFLERSVPVPLAWSAKASTINLAVAVEDVAFPVNDMDAKLKMVRILSF